MFSTGKHTEKDSTEPPAGILSLREIAIKMNSRRTATMVPMRGVGSAWIDQDDSGNYDPKADGRRPARTKRIRLANNADDNDEERNHRTSRGPRVARPVGYRELIIFTFEKEAGLTYLRSITPGPYSDVETDGEESSEEFSDESELEDADHVPRRRVRRKRKAPIAKAREDGLTIGELTNGHFQRRGCKACFNAGDDDCSLIEDCYGYPCTACIDAGKDCELIVPPKVKKVCERCKKKRISCSYRIDGGRGVTSCDACTEAEVSCNAGPMKDSFHSTRYNDVLDDSGNVRQNARPPPKSRTKQTTRLNASSKASSSPSVAPSNKPCPPRLYVSCNQCREEGLRCSCKRDKPGPCSNCHKKGEDCRFVILSKPRREGGSKNSQCPVRSNITGEAHKSFNGSLNREDHHFPSDENLRKTLFAESWYNGAGKRRPTPSGSSITNKNKASHSKKQTNSIARKVHSSSPSRSRSTSPQLIGRTDGLSHIKIETSFSHPITFLYQPAPDGSHPCDWCTSPVFGQVGYGKRVVEVIPYPQGYEEIGEGKYRGWSQEGESTNMCRSCTNLRYNTIICGDHQMILLEDQAPELLNKDMNVSALLGESLEALINGDLEGASLILQAKFCSICFSAAEYRCNAKQDKECCLEVEGRVPENGCGLLLCEPCKDLLGHINANLLEIQKWEEAQIIVLDRLIHMVETGQGGGSDTELRADAKFLVSTGDLFKAVLPDASFADDSLKSADSSDDDGDGTSNSEDDVWQIFDRIGKGKAKGINARKFVAKPEAAKPSKTKDVAKHRDNWNYSTPPSRGGRVRKSTSVPGKGVINNLPKPEPNILGDIGYGFKN